MKRIGIIGAGGQARRLGRAFAALDGVRIGGVAGRTTTNAVGLIGDIGGRFYQAPRALIDDAEVDAVVVACPTALHCQYVVDALDSGKHVFCETPIAETLADADRMIAAAARNDRVLVIGLVHRVESIYRHLRQMILKGGLGRPLWVTTERLIGSFFLPAGSILGDTHYGDAIFELMAFDIDFLNWIFGMPRGVVAAHGTRDRGDGTDYVMATIDYGGFPAHCEAGIVNSDAYSFTTRLRLNCEGGLVELDCRFPKDFSAPAVDFVWYRKDGQAETQTPKGYDPFAAECAYFIDCVNGREDPELLSPVAAREALVVCLDVQAALAR